MYSIKYSPWFKKYLVINTQTGLMQSAWECKQEATQAMRFLSRLVNNSAIK